MSTPNVHPYGTCDSKEYCHTCWCNISAMISLFQIIMNVRIDSYFKCLVCRAKREISHITPNYKIVFPCLNSIITFDICTSCYYVGEIITEHEYNNTTDRSIMCQARISKHNFEIYISSIRHRYEVIKTILTERFSKDESSIIIEYSKH